MAYQSIRIAVLIKCDFDFEGKTNKIKFILIYYADLNAAWKMYIKLHKLLKILSLDLLRLLNMNIEIMPWKNCRSGCSYILCDQ